MFSLSAQERALIITSFTFFLTSLKHIVFMKIHQQLSDDTVSNVTINKQVTFIFAAQSLLRVVSGYGTLLTNLNVKCQCNIKDMWTANKVVTRLNLYNNV